MRQPRDFERSARGFTLIELMVVITILGLLASITSVAVMKHLKEAKIQTTKEKMRQIKQSIQMYYIKKNRIPTALTELVGTDEDTRFLDSDEVPKDGWNNEFVYQPRDKKNYELLSLGSDGVEGGDGDARDITKEDMNKSDPADDQ